MRSLYLRYWLFVHLLAQRILCAVYIWWCGRSQNFCRGFERHTIILEKFAASAAEKLRCRSWGVEISNQPDRARRNFKVFVSPDVLDVRSLTCDGLFNPRITLTRTVQPCEHDCRQTLLVGKALKIFGGNTIHHWNHLFTWNGFLASQISLCHVKMLRSSPSWSWMSLADLWSAEWQYWLYRVQMSS